MRMPLRRRAALLAPLTAAVLGLANAAAPTASAATGSTPGSYTNYGWSGASQLSSVTFGTKVLTDPGRANVYWAHQFGFSNGTHGYTGMQRDRTDPGLYLFSVWGSTAAQAGGSGTYCETFSENGTGYTCRLKAAFPAGHNVQTTVASTGGGWYRATVSDTTAGTSFVLGSLQVGSGATVKTAGMADWTEYYDWNNPAATCADEPYSAAFFTAPSGVDAAGGGRVTASVSSSYPSSTCQSDTSITVGGGGSTQTNGIGNSTSGSITGPGGLCADATGGSGADGTPIQLYSCTGGDNQNWVLAENGTVHAQYKCLDISGGAAADGTPVVLYRCNGGANQQWKLNNGTLVNPQSGKCLDADGGSGTSGTRLQLWSCNGTSAQKWKTPYWPAA
ncbi:lectin [Streptomyces sp. SID5910]|uniref:lectin n=1 Tax=Streptomyces sp. SID5910 TaxID=2690312 RepID=UPI001367FF9D|nr:lectin [Streptomyces sp. SID5910]MYR42443.1 hypothetical protein [Streptomyces sp. SID5910]